MGLLIFPSDKEPCLIAWVSGSGTESWEQGHFLIHGRGLGSQDVRTPRRCPRHPEPFLLHTKGPDMQTESESIL